MNNWFTVKVKYTKQLENGTLKRVTEPYLLAAMTFTDAEARIYEELGSIVRGEFMVTGISRTDIQDIFQYDDADTWFNCKIKYANEEGDGEKNRSVTQQFLVSAPDVKEAFLRMQESLSTLMIDYQILGIVSSPIIEIFPYHEDDVARPVQGLRENVEESNKGVVFSIDNTEDEDMEEVDGIEEEEEADGDSNLTDSYTPENE